jgi:uncharacterized protein (UPF0335 family)
MSDGRTHWEGCYKECGHKDCAVAQIERLQAEIKRLRAAISDIKENCHDWYVVELCEKALKGDSDE